MLRIGNAAGFLGDRLDAPGRLVRTAELDYLTLEYLAELTMSILARQREQAPAAGYAADLLTVLADLAGEFRRQPQLHLVTNGGGVNPRGCAVAAGKLLAAAGLESLPIGVATGDDLRPRLADLAARGIRFEHFDTGEPLGDRGGQVVCAHAYLGAAPLVECLAGGARLVLAGRVADAALTLAPAVHHFGWNWRDWPRLAGGTVAGHLIECGCQVTGGYAPRADAADLAEIGYPIALVAEDGSCTITKPAGSGGAVTVDTVRLQLVYEIGDPRHYLTPDVDVDFTALSVEQVGADRVQVRGAAGQPPPADYKVSLAYQAGYTASGQLLLAGRGCVDRARACAQIIFRRLAAQGIRYARQSVELLGGGAGVPVGEPDLEAGEVVLRLCVADPRRTAVEQFTREFAPLATCGPAGLAGYAVPRSPVRPVFAYWPARIPRDLVPARAEVRTAGQWAQETT